jgi:RimK family alpha-L-glutamate ligase
MQPTHTARRHGHFRSGRQFAIVARRLTPTNVALVRAASALGEEARLLEPEQAVSLLRRDDIALARLDVLPSLDGLEPGSELLPRLQVAGVDVRNNAGALLLAHDKLASALRLARAGVAHPRTAHIGNIGQVSFPLPVVVKPRFGSWGKDVVLCRSQRALRRHLRGLADRDWFQQQGAIVQELIPPCGHDLRVVVAGGTVVGAIERVARAGEWRTNVALGATRRPVDPPLDARLLAVEAATALGADLCGVDLLPDGRGGYIVLEVNGAVDFTHEYALDSGDVYQGAIAALLRDRRSFAAADASGPLPGSAAAERFERSPLLVGERSRP